MRIPHRIVPWLALLALFTFNPQLNIAWAADTALPTGNARPTTATLKSNAANKTQAIPWDQIGAKAGVDYQGNGLAVTPTSGGARLHCIFQQLDGEATAGGLWLTSTVTNQPGDRFQVKAVRLGRADTTSPLADTGTVTVDRKTVRFERAGLVEEYEVSLDGVKQDFVVAAKSIGSGELIIRLAVTGAKAEPGASGAQLVLANSGRKIAYSRLRVLDAKGIELPGRMEVVNNSKMNLAVFVNDAGAQYPLRVDPTFSDANWFTLGPGINGLEVSALAVSGNNLYAGGYFTNAGVGTANYIARWNGTSWRDLGSGMNGWVDALAVSGTNVYAGGNFTTAGGVAATNIAEWNGSSWTNLGSGVDGEVYALALSGSNLYAGGQFATAGGVRASRIAQWDGISWTNLGGGIDLWVYALAVSGTNLYAGGDFYQVFSDNYHNQAVVANGIAQWNGSSWTNLGSGMDSVYRQFRDPFVAALAVLGTNVYAGGDFTSAGGVAATNIAVWNGSSWTNLGEGLGVGISGTCARAVAALVVSDTNLYAAGCFTNSGGEAVNNIALWDGSTWSALGSGTGPGVNALAVSGNTLYAGGYFSTAGGVAANCIAQGIIGPPILTVGVVNSKPELYWRFIPGSTNLVWATTNLGLPFPQWQVIATNVVGTNGRSQFIDYAAASNDATFYRVSAP